jgi:hypothetical protein
MSLHAHDPLLNGSKWTAVLRIYASPVPFASRSVIPAIAILSGGEIPQWITRFRFWAMERFGVDRGIELFNYLFLIGAVIAFATIPLLVALRIISLRRSKASKSKSE